MPDRYPSPNPTRAVSVGGVTVGGGNPVAVQSMTNTDTRDVEATLRQIFLLAGAGCEIVRVAVVDETAARAIRPIRERSPRPVVADIHFDDRLALLSVENGADKIRINPGNLGGADKLRQVAAACSSRGIPIRVGINSGSLEKHLLEKYGAPCGEALAESALLNTRLLEDCGFHDIVISVKSSSVYHTVTANRMIARNCGYPIHIGVTEAGSAHMGTLKNTAAMSSLLMDGIGDTIRVSLTENPVMEVAEGIAILRALGMRENGVEIISCPTCGRCRVDIIALARELEERLSAPRYRDFPRKITVAVMGCAVNGPGEARQADIGLAGGNGELLMFRRGEIIRKVPQEDAVAALMCEIDTLTAPQDGENNE